MNGPRIFDAIFSNNFHLAQRRPLPCLLDAIFLLSIRMSGSSVLAAQEDVFLERALQAPQSVHPSQVSLDAPRYFYIKH